MFPTDDEVDELMKFMDGDGSGQIELEELMKNMAHQIQVHKKRDPEEEFKKAFSFFDKDGSGTISLDELRTCLQSEDFTLSEDLLESLLREVDADGNGFIEYNEFIQAMKMNSDYSKSVLGTSSLSELSTWGCCTFWI